MNIRSEHQMPFRSFPYKGEAQKQSPRQSNDEEEVLATGRQEMEQHITHRKGGRNGPLINDGAAESNSPGTTRRIPPPDCPRFLAVPTHVGQDRRWARKALDMKLLALLRGVCSITSFFFTHVTVCRFTTRKTKYHLYPALIIETQYDKGPRYRGGEAEGQGLHRLTLCWF